MMVLMVDEKLCNCKINVHITVSFDLVYDSLTCMYPRRKWLTEVMEWSSAIHNYEEGEIEISTCNWLFLNYRQKDLNYKYKTCTKETYHCL